MISRLIATEEMIPIAGKKCCATCFKHASRPHYRRQWLNITLNELSDQVCATYGMRLSIKNHAACTRNVKCKLQWPCNNKTICLLHEDTLQKGGQTIVWKQAGLGVWKQNRNNDKKILKSLAAVIQT